MGSKSYNRDKDPNTNATGIVITGEARELPNALAAIAAGTTGDFEVAISGDADPTGGATIVQLYRISLTTVLQAANPGTQSLKVTVTPVNGDASDAAAKDIKTLTVVHPQTMTAWQSDAGHAPVA